MDKRLLNSKTMLMDKLCFAAVWAVIGSSVSPVCPASCPMRGCPSRAPTFSIPVAPCTPWGGHPPPHPDTAVPSTGLVSQLPGPICGTTHPALR